MKSKRHLNTFNAVLLFIILTAVSLFSFKAHSTDTAFERMLEGIQTQYQIRDGHRYLMDGINCHGTSFQAAGLLSYPSHMAKEELNYLFDHHCTRVNGPAAGVIAVISRHSNFSHSYFHTDTDSIIEKRSLSRNSPTAFLSRGPRRSAEYYQCRRLPTTCSQQEVVNLRREVQLVGFYYASISTGHSDFRMRSRMLAYLNQKIQRLQTIRLDSSCVSLKNLVYNRAQSIAQMAEHVDGMGLFLSQLPANKL